nr:hypothetical protein [Vibrio vulnificus]
EQTLWGHYQQRNALPNHGFRENAQNDELYCDLRYQGQIEDRESGLYYNVNRYYDADSGVPKPRPNRVFRRVEATGVCV